MNYIVAYESRRGKFHTVNQDAMILKKKKFQETSMIFASICDGMGGLSRGELASATVIKAFNSWFEKDYKELVNMDRDKIFCSWERILEETNNKINLYGRKNGIQIGTTATGILMVERNYYIFHIGDTRIYHMKENGISRLTTDHTVAQMQIDQGILKYGEEERCTDKSVLTRCIGAREHAVPEFYSGELEEKDAVLLCSDGARHLISDETWKHFYAQSMISGNDTQKEIEQLLNHIYECGETDDASVVYIRPTS